MEKEKKENVIGRKKKAQRKGHFQLEKQGLKLQLKEGKNSEDSVKPTIDFHSKIKIKKN